MLGTNTQNVIANARLLAGRSFYLLGVIEYMDVPPVDLATITAQGCNCLVGETEVIAPGTEKAFSRFYEGKVVTIETAGGHKLTATPNHPVLSSRGWVGIGKLKKGDRVVSRSSESRALSGDGEEHEQDKPALIKELYSSFARSGDTERVAETPLDFHGDGGNGKVNIVESDSFLPNGSKPTRLEALFEFLFALTGQAKAPFVIPSLKLQPRFGLRAATQRFISRHGLFSPLLSGGSAVSEAGSFARGTGRYSRLAQPLLYNPPVNAEMLGNHPVTCADSVEAEHFINRDRDATATAVPALGGIGASTNLDSSSLEAVLHDLVSHPKALTQGKSGLPAGVCFDNVINVESHTFIGDVYNLQTESGCYLADSIVTHNCSGYLNWSRATASLPPIGGTPDYANAIGPNWWEYLQNPAKQYPPGTYLVNNNVGDGFDFSHVAMVSTWDQYVLQSDNYQGRGPHELEHVAESHQYNGFYYAGLIDDQPVLDGFPGYSASPEDIARWTGDVMEFFGLPRQLFVQCSLPELTTIWIDRPTDSIWDLPGYSTAVDHDSYGPAQQRLMYYPFPWSFETAVWSFAQQALAQAPSSDPASLTAEGYGEWIQRVQVSAEPERYAQWYDTAVELVGASPAPTPAPGPIEEGIVFSKYTFAGVGEPYVDFCDAAATAINALGGDAMSVSSEVNIKALSKEAATTNQVATLNCLTVGAQAHQFLDDSARPLDDWKDGDPIWKLWADDGSGARTLSKVRDWALVWIAVTEKLDKDKLLSMFDALLMAIDSKAYGELLAEAEHGNYPNPPPPPEPTLEEKVAILWDAYEKSKAA